MAGSVYSAFQKKGGEAGEQVSRDPFPDVRWISVKDGSREVGDLVGGAPIGGCIGGCIGGYNLIAGRTTLGGRPTLGGQDCSIHAFKPLVVRVNQVNVNSACSGRGRDEEQGSRCLRTGRQRAMCKVGESRIPLPAGQIRLGEPGPHVAHIFQVTLPRAEAARSRERVGGSSRRSTSEGIENGLEL